MSNQIANLLLINLDDPSGTQDIEFRRFPRQIDTTDEVNYEQNDVASFTKSLTYANNDPQTIELQELWVDRSDTNESILGDIEKLRGLTKKLPKLGRPPRLQLVCGDWEIVAVLKSIRTERTRFTSDNVQVRARVSLTLWQVEEERRGRVTVTEVDDQSPSTNSGTVAGGVPFGPPS